MRRTWRVVNMNTTSFTERRKNCRKHVRCNGLRNRKRSSVSSYTCEEWMTMKMAAQMNITPRSCPIQKLMSEPWPTGTGEDSSAAGSGRSCVTSHDPVRHRAPMEYQYSAATATTSSHCRRQARDISRLETVMCAAPIGMERSNKGFPAPGQ